MFVLLIRDTGDGAEVQSRQILPGKAGRIMQTEDNSVRNLRDECKNTRIKSARSHFLSGKTGAKIVQKPRKQHTPFENEDLTKKITANF